MRVLFPEKFGDDSANFYMEMIRKARLQCQLIKGVTDRDNTLRLIRDIELWQLNLMAPKNFDSTNVDNHIKKIELSFESLCTSVEELGVANPGALSVFQFYVKLTYFEKKRLRQKAK